MTRHEPIRILVIDDSAFSRQTITRMLESSPLVEVVGVARDGEDALRKTLELEPDLITLDLQMPRMDGFTFLRIVMARRPTPIIVISSRRGEDDVFRALDLGAVDFIAKPTAHPAPELQTIEEGLIRKVHAIRDLRIDRVADRIQKSPPILTAPGAEVSGITPVVVIGSSTGGPPALTQILGAFPEPPPCAFLVAQHMPPGFTRGFAERLDRLTPLRVREAEGGERIEAGTVLIAPGGGHLELEIRDSRLRSRLDRDVDSARNVPSVDRLFSSAAKVAGEDLLAIVLTGMGDDGRKGACQVKAAGGRVIAESEETALIYGMPRQVVAAGAADEILPLPEIPAAIQRALAPGVRRGSRRGRRE
ncbi:MAG TPA: chemotaxis response regulator protein-glutamate methylesterase [Deltaproteobacteria bacterium]|nr:chemotaxis response regulator protein-glutamate methylesterase [Deltaproteobacteria bacterium]